MHVTDLTIRVLTSAEDLKQVRDLETIVWDGDDPVPVHQTATAAKHGGLILGAFDGERLIGFQYSFAGFDGKKVYLCSHTLGIDHAYRSSGIGAMLKWRQREEALRIGYDLITWTYDPLETANGYLNIKKLGAICKNYLPNFYGEMTDTLNAGLPSDRFMVEWWIKNDAVVQKAQQGSQHTSEKETLPVIHTNDDQNGYPVVQSIDLNQTNADTSLVVPVPTSFQTLKKYDQNSAIDWRMKTREVFMHYFQHGWHVNDFIKNDMATKNVHYYVLSK